MLMRPHFYVLRNKVAMPVDNVTEWGAWMEIGDRRVAWTEYPDRDCHVSTVFLGIDHGFGDGPPVLFETMAFAAGNDAIDQRMWRCSTYAEAEAMHRDACAFVLSMTDPDAANEATDAILARLRGSRDEQAR